MLYETSTVSMKSQPDSQFNKIERENALVNYIQKLQSLHCQRERELCHENEKLKREIQEQQNKNNKIEANYDDLVNEVQDLRKVAKRIYEEGEIDRLKVKSREVQLLLTISQRKQSKEIECLQKSLANLTSQITHFSLINDYWQDYQEEEKNGKLC